MVLGRFGPRRGPGDAGLVAGLHVTAESAILVALRPNPIRLVAIARQLIFDPVLASDPDGSSRALVDAVKIMAKQLRLAPGTPTVVLVEPLQDELTIADTKDDLFATCPVDQATYARLSGVIQQTPLELMAFDPVPVALARLALLSGWATAAIEGPGRWSVVAGIGFVEATRAVKQRTATLSFGPDPMTARPIDHLPGVDVPKRLQPTVRAMSDAAAVGGALLALELPPLVLVQPTDRFEAERSQTEPTVSEAEFDPPTQEETTRNGHGKS